MEPNQTPVPAPVTSLPPGELKGPSELIIRAFDLFRVHWKTFTTIAVIPMVFQLIAQACNPALNHTLSVNIASQALLGLVSFVASMAAAIFSLASYGALIDAANKLDADPQASLGLTSQYKIGFSFFWSLLLVVVLVNLATIGGFALFVIPGIIIAGYVYFANVALVVDGKRGYEALTESFALVRGRWWNVFWRMLVFVIAIGIALLATSLISAGLIFLVSMAGKGFAGLIAILINLVVYIAILPITFIYLTVFYKDLKATRSTGDVIAAQAKFRMWAMVVSVFGIIAAIVLVIAVPAVVLWSLNQVRNQEQSQSVPGMPHTGTQINPGAGGIPGPDYFPGGSRPGMNTGASGSGTGQ